MKTKRGLGDLQKGLRVPNKGGRQTSGGQAKRFVWGGGGDERKSFEVRRVVKGIKIHPGGRGRQKKRGKDQNSQQSKDFGRKELIRENKGRKAREKRVELRPITGVRLRKGSERVDVPPWGVRWRKKGGSQQKI